MSRLAEGVVLLSEFFPNFHIEKKRVWEYENYCEDVDKNELENLYQEITEFINLKSK